MPHDGMGIEALTEATPGYSAALANGISGVCQNEANAQTGTDMGLPSFTDKLLNALATMAVRSKRRQADLSAAMNRSGLQADQAQMTDALRELEAEGLIENIVPLYDGGVLLLVTSRGIEKRSGSVRWTVPAPGHMARA